MSAAESGHDLFQRRGVEFYLYATVAILLAMLTWPSVSELFTSSEPPVTGVGTIKTQDHPHDPSPRGIASSGEMRGVGNITANASTTDMAERTSGYPTMELDPGSIADAKGQFEVLKVRKPLNRNGRMIGSLFVRIDEGSNLHVELEELRDAVGSSGSEPDPLSQLPKNGEVSFALLRDFGLDILYDPTEDAVVIR